MQFRKLLKDLCCIRNFRLQDIFDPHVCRTSNAKFAEYYTVCGKSRAWLRNPVRWVILKHIDKLRFNVKEQEEKPTAKLIEGIGLEQRFDEHLYEDSNFGILAQCGVNSSRTRFSFLPGQIVRIYPGYKQA